MTKTARQQQHVQKNDDERLLQYGVCRVAIPSHMLDRSHHWAQTLSQVTPLNMSLEGVAEYAFYRNILDEPDFPFDDLLLLSSEIGTCLQQYFCGNNNTATSFDNVPKNDDDGEPDVSTLSQKQPHEQQHEQRQQQQQQQLLSLDQIIRLDDAFCVHYNMNQADTTGAKHTDPSDITVNICLEASDDFQGSQVLFYGTRPLLLSPLQRQQQEEEGDTPSSPTSPQEEDDFQFLVDQIPGFATIHWGAHPHETLALKQGHRTNVVLTYCFQDPARSTVLGRTCYFDTTNKVSS